MTGAGWKPIPLSDLWGPGGRERVDDFVRTQLLPPDVAQEEHVVACRVKRLYFDPRLKRGKAYPEFLRRMAAWNLVDFSFQEPREEVAIFFVTKKNKRLRVIVDARRSNAHFKSPSQVNLSAGESLGAIELGPDESLVVCQADLKDAFYHFELPKPLREVFGLPRVRARDVGADHIDGVKVVGSAWIFPRLAVVPMGWSHALYICQSIHEELAERSGLVESGRVRDGKRAPPSQCTHAQYVDNMVVMGSTGSQVQDRFEHAVKELKRAGLQVHEEETSVGDAAVLGWEYSSSGLFRPSRKRAWKARQAVRALLQRGRATGGTIEKVLGHLTFVSLCRREALSVSGEVYNFIKNHRFNRREVPLPWLVRKELKRLAMPFRLRCSPTKVLWPENARTGGFKEVRFKSGSQMHLPKVRASTTLALLFQRNCQSSWTSWAKLSCPIGSGLTITASQLHE